MTLFKDIAAELIGMFLGDARLSAAILAVVAVSAAVAKLADPGPLPAAVLLGGALLVVVVAVRRSGRRILETRDRAASGGPEA